MEQRLKDSATPPAGTASVPRAGGGREELRANLLKPYLLRLRSVKDEAAVRAIMSLAAIPLSVIDDETGWISVAAARRALGAIEDALGTGALTRRDTWLTHPENLGTYVRLLRTATKPLDAYRFLAQNPDQASRIGAYDLTELSPLSVRMTYRLRGDEEEVQRHRLFCDAREGELTSMPRFWAQPDATCTHESDLAKDDPACTYLVKWTPATSPWGPYISPGARG